MKGQRAWESDADGRKVGKGGAAACEDGENGTDRPLPQIRAATPEDARKLLDIYAYYVAHTAITFEIGVPSEEEFEERIRRALRTYPYLVATEGGEPIGYACAGPFKDRAAYDWSVETTVYVCPDRKREGIGRLLYEALERALARQGFLNLYACIASPIEEDDPYLTRDSIEFHRRLGYRLVGEFLQCGHKFGRWYDMVWMEKTLGQHGENPTPPRAFSSLLQEAEGQKGKA